MFLVGFVCAWFVLQIRIDDRSFPANSVPIYIRKVAIFLTQKKPSRQSFKKKNPASHGRPVSPPYPVTITSLHQCFYSQSALRTWRSSNLKCGLSSFDDHCDQSKDRPFNLEDHFQSCQVSEKISFTIGFVLTYKLAHANRVHVCKRGGVIYWFH